MKSEAATRSLSCFLIQEEGIAAQQKRSSKRSIWTFQIAFQPEMVDFFKEYAPPPFDLVPELYPPMPGARCCGSLDIN